MIQGTVIYNSQMVKKKYFFYKWAGFMREDRNLVFVKGAKNSQKKNQPLSYKFNSS